ncbi:MAG: hypothetical protein AABX38_07495 [Candidatus Micrarchaeota archaeon]
MAIVTCERCGDQIAKAQKCNYCSKQICNYCVKSAKRKHKIKRYYICKSCWGKMTLRSKFKSA